MFTPYVIWYLFFGGAGAGAFLSAVVIDIRAAQPGDIRRMPLPAMLGFASSAAFLVLAIVLLILDLGNSEKALLAFLKPFESLVSAGAWLLVLGISVSAAIVALLVFRRGSRTLLRTLEAVGSMLALGIVLYTGMLLSSLASVDFWNTPLLVLLFAASAFGCGAALIMFLTFLFEGGVHQMQGLTRISSVCLGAEVLALVGFLASRWFYTPTAQQSCQMLFSGDLAGIFWGGLVLIGLAVPLAVTVVHHFAPIPSLKLVDAGATLVGGICLRYCVILAAAYTAVSISVS